MIELDESTIIGRIATRVAVENKLAFLAINDVGKLLNAGGALSHFGINDLQIGTHVLDELVYLHGILPLEETSWLSLPFVKVGRGANTTLHVFREDSVTWITLLDAAVSHSQTQHIQQSAHEHRLESDRKQGVIDQFLGQEIAYQISAGLNSVKATGERRDVTVLFADLRGFTAFCDHHATIEIFPVLNQYLNAMIKPILDNGGVVDKIIGDAVMAVFGLGDPTHENHKIAAIASAREMIQHTALVAKQLAEQSNGRAQHVTGLGIGVSSGDVAVGILGTERRRSFSVIGHRVNLASRLEGQARAGEILIDIPTWEGLGEVQELFSATDLTLKGLSRAISAMSYRTEELPPDPL